MFFLKSSLIGNIQIHYLKYDYRLFCLVKRKKLTLNLYSHFYSEGSWCFSLQLSVILLESVARQRKYKFPIDIFMGVTFSLWSQHKLLVDSCFSAFIVGNGHYTRGKLKNSPNKTEFQVLSDWTDGSTRWPSCASDIQIKGTPGFNLILDYRGAV